MVGVLVTTSDTAESRAVASSGVLILVARAFATKTAAAASGVVISTMMSTEAGLTATLTAEGSTLADEAMADRMASLSDSVISVTSPWAIISTRVLCTLVMTAPGVAGGVGGPTGKGGISGWGGGDGDGGGCGSNGGGDGVPMTIPSAMAGG